MNDRTADVTNALVQDAMLTLPRELFMPEGKQDLAYLDLAVPAAGRSTRRLLTPTLPGNLTCRRDGFGGLGGLTSPARQSHWLRLFFFRFSSRCGGHCERPACR